MPAQLAVSPVTERLGFTDLVRRLSGEAPRRDRDRLLFTDLRPELRASRIGAIRLPRADGSRLRLTEFFQFILDLAIADSNLAHSLRNHYVAIENAILEPTPSSPRLLALAAEGLLFGGAAQERTGSSGSEPPDTKVEPLGEDEYLLSCRRCYATGSVYADYLSLLVTLGGVQRTVLIESDRPGVELPDDWDGFGQRLTGSGSIVLDRVRITGADYFQRPVIDEDRPRYPFTFNQVHLTTVVAGIANRALLDAVELVRGRTRNYYHGTAGHVQDEPVIQAVIGVASAKAFAATATRSGSSPRILDYSDRDNIVSVRSRSVPETGWRHVLSISAPGPMHLSVALDGAGWHPAAWREPGARPAELFTAGYWTDVITEAERGLLDFVTIEDGLGLQSADRGRPDSRPDQVRGRLDAVLVAARVAPVTRHIGLVPVVVVTHTEPFHISKAIATLDYVSSGRAGVQVRVSASPRDAAHFGRRAIPPLDLRDRADPAVQQLITGLFAEAADYVEVIRRLWDSWEDDAEIRDTATGRFVDRGKLHYIKFTGDYFSVKGPSITPRPPQGQPVVAALGHASVPYRLIGQSADVGFVTPHDPAQARAIVAEIQAAHAEAGRGPETINVFADLVVFLAPDAHAAADRKAWLDELAGREYASDAAVFSGTPAQLASLLQEWQQAGLSGFRLRPGGIPADLQAITRDLVPELQRRGVFRTSYDAGPLRGRLGLGRPASRYAVSGRS